MAESFGKFIPTILGIGKNFLRFLRFLGPIGLVASLLMSLDFEKDLVEPIKKIIDTFANGDWIEGISRVITFIPDTIAKGILRFGSWIAEKLGFDGLAETLSGFADNFNIVDMVKNVWTSITTGIGGAISSITDSLSKFSFNIPAFIPDSVLSMTGLPRIIQPFKGLSPTSNMSAPASPPSANVGSVIAEKSTDVADAKNAQQPIVIAPQSTNVNQVSTSTTNAIAMRSRPRSMNESIQRTSRESYSSAGGYSVG